MYSIPSPGKAGLRSHVFKTTVAAALVMMGSTANPAFSFGDGLSTTWPPPGQTGGTHPLAIQSFYDLSIRLFGPDSVVFDTYCNVYIADRTSATVRQITSGGEVRTIAGKAGERGDTDGTGESARFSGPRSISIDGSGNLYVTDGHAIRKLTPEGVVTTIAGAVTMPGNVDGPGSAARFYAPADVVADNEGNLFVADWNNDLIRKITPDGMVSTVSGIRGQGSHIDGPASTAQFTGPFALTFDRAGNLYVWDEVFPPSNFSPSNVSYVRRIDSDGTVTSIVSSNSPPAQLQALGMLETMGSDRFGCTGRHIRY